MFGTLLISICTVLHLYVFWRIATLPVVRRQHLRIPVVLSGVFLWTIFFLGRTVGHGGSEMFATALEFAGMNWMAVLFLLFVSFLAVDIVTGFGFFCPRLAPRLRRWALAAGCLLSLVACVQGFRAPVVTHYEVRMAGLPAALDNTVVVAVSDTHLGSQLGGRWMDARISQVLAEKPDLIVLLGDIYEGHGGNPDALVPILHRLTAPLGVWAVLGNHDMHGGGNGSQRLMEAADINVLRNRWAEIANGLILAGVDDLGRRHSAQNKDAIVKTVSGRPKGATLLLSHTPSQIAQAADAGVGLMLSGHTHAGQIWPFGYLVRLAYPLLEGLHIVKEMPLIICRGTGTWGPRMRLWKPGEILRITLRSDTEAI